MTTNAQGFWFAATGDPDSGAKNTLAPCRESADALNSGVSGEGVTLNGNKPSGPATGYAFVSRQHYNPQESLDRLGRPTANGRQR
jgi:hypothetical protein